MSKLFSFITNRNMPKSSFNPEKLKRLTITDLKSIIDYYANYEPSNRSLAADAEVYHMDEEKKKAWADRQGRLSDLHYALNSKLQQLEW